MHLIIALTLFLQSFTTVSLAQTDARYSQNNTATYKAEDKSGLGNETMNLLAAIANGIVIKSFFIGCKPITTDMMLAGAGAGIYLIGELMNLLKYRDITKKQIEYAKNGNLTDTQVQALEEAKKNYEDQVKAVKTKLTLLYASTAAYTAAAAAAGIQALTLHMAYGTYEGAVKSGQSAIATAAKADAATCASTVGTAGTTCAAPAIAAADITAKETIMTSFRTNRFAAEGPAPSLFQASSDIKEQGIQLTATTGSDTTAVTVTPSATAAAIVASNKAITTASGAFWTKAKAVHVTCNPATIATPFFENIQNNPMTTTMLIAGLLIGLMSSNANATFLNKFGLPAAVITAIFISSSFMKKLADNWIYTPLKRAALWGIMAAASGLAALTTKSLLGKAEDEVKEIDAILAKYRNYKGARDISTNPIQNQIIDQSDWMRRNLKFNPDEVLAQGPALNRNGNCLFQASNGNCMSAGRAAQTFASGTSGLISDTALGAGNLADSLSSGTITGNNLNAAAALGNQLAKLNKVKKEIDAKLANIPLRDENKKPLKDFDAYYNKRLASITKAAANKANLGADASTLMASLGTGASLSAKAVDELAELAPKEDLSNVNLNTTGGGFASMPSFNFTEDKKTQEEVGASDTVSVMGGAADAEPEFAYETNRDQVHQDKNANIFEIVSHRYLRTAYPTFFTEQ